MTRCFAAIAMISLLVSAPLPVRLVAAAEEPASGEKTDEQLQRQVDQIGKQIDRLEEELKKARQNTQVELKKRIPELRARQRDLQAKFSQLQVTGKKAWKEIAEGAQKAIEELNAALERASKSAAQEE